MNGKVLKISSNDLYGNADDRQIVVFAAFTHVKYNNKYVIFAFKDEYNKNKLCYGSIHLKNNSLVIFSVDNSVKQHIDKFTNDYLTNKLDPKEFTLIDISSMTKSELVSYSEEDYDKLVDLDNLSIQKENTVEESKSGSSHVFLYLLLIIMIVLLGGITYLYFFPEEFTVELKQLECQKEDYNKHIDLGYTTDKLYRFDKNEVIRDINVTDTYKFINYESYKNFKDNNLQNEYFKIDGGYKYIDESLELKLMYQEETIIQTYEELKKYMISEGYNCTEGNYYE